MTSALHVVTASNGQSSLNERPPRTLLFIHGSASDHTTWLMQLGGVLTGCFFMIAYDRRGYGQSPSGHNVSVPQHADDARDVLNAYMRGAAKPIVVGSSFGAVIALDLARRFPTDIGGLVLIEPPMAASDDVALIPPGFLDEFDQCQRTAGGAAAGEFFLRTVLGDVAFERMPKLYAQRSAAMYAGIRADSAALGNYPPRYHELASLQVATLLLGGERSASYFRATLDSLQAYLPSVQRALINNAGHMLHAEASKKFAEQLIGFATQLASSSPR